MDTAHVLSKETYESFLRVLINLRDMCNDLDCRKGVIRQRTNDMTAIFEADLNMFVFGGDVDIPIADLKKKVELFKAFQGSDSVYIHTYSSPSETGSDNQGGYFTISDDISLFRFLYPTLSLLDNKYVSEEELGLIISLDEDKLIMEVGLEPAVTYRIRIVTNNFGAQVIQMVFEKDKASLVMKTSSKDQTAVFKRDIPLNVEFDERFVANMSVLPFCIDHDGEMVLSVYSSPDEGVIYNQLTTNIGDIPVSMYSRSSIMSG